MRITNKLNNDKPIILFGLGFQFHDYYQQIVQLIGREPDYLCDNSPQKWNKHFYGKRCISVEELELFDKNTNIIITIRAYEAIFMQLKKLGMNNINLALFDRTYDYVAGIKQLEDKLFKKIERSFDSHVIGKWTFITGASRGIGAQIAMKMAKLGSNLILHSSNITHTKKVAEICKKNGVDVKSISANFANLTEVNNFLSKLISEFPPIDIVFNNAGISLSSKNSVWDIPSKNYLLHYTVNTVVPIQICNKLIPLMIDRGYGKIINITSTIQKSPLEISYAVSKAALNKFVFDLAPSLKNTGVIISSTCPGHVRSDMGGNIAPNSLESVIPGVLLGAIMNNEIHGRCIIAQDYSELNLPEAIEKAKFILGLNKETTNDK